MKKLLFLGLLSIAAVSTCARDAHAWFFGCCCRDRCCTTVCLRPYNAFTPVCCGNISCNGCCGPINCFGGCCPQQRAPMGYGYASYGAGGCAGGCDYGCLPAPGSFATAQQTPAQIQLPPAPVQTAPQAAPGPQFMPPSPQLINPGINPSMYMVPMQMPMPAQPMYGYGTVQPVGYYPGYQPAYNQYYAPQVPVNYYGPLQAPGYWYGR